MLPIRRFTSAHGKHLTFSIQVYEHLGHVRDPKEYPDPEFLWPERFLENKPPKDPADYVFRFRRRICPGLHFSTATSFIHFASILHAFDIRPPVDAVDLLVKLEYNTLHSLGRFIRAQRDKSLLLASGVRYDRHSWINSCRVWTRDLLEAMVNAGLLQKDMFDFMDADVPLKNRVPESSGIEATYSLRQFYSLLPEQDSYRRPDLHRSRITLYSIDSSQRHVRQVARRSPISRMLFQ